jgi:hypothetical protein
MAVIIVVAAGIIQQEFIECAEKNPNHQTLDFGS